MTLIGKFAGFTECRKKYIHDRRLSAVICSTESGIQLVLVRRFKTLAQTSRLMLGGAIPYIKNSNSTHI